MCLCASSPIAHVQLGEVDLPGDSKISKDNHEPFDISRIEDVTLFHHYDGRIPFSEGMSLAPPFTLISGDIRL